jgi:hypothetical protein
MKSTTEKLVPVMPAILNEEPILTLPRTDKQLPTAVYKCTESIDPSLEVDLMDKLLDPQVAFMSEAVKPPTLNVAATDTEDPSLANPRSDIELALCNCENTDMLLPNLAHCLTETFPPTSSLPITDNAWQEPVINSP